METREECCLPAHPQVHASLASDMTQDSMPRGTAAHSGLGPPVSIYHRDSLPEACPQASLSQAIPQSWLLLSDGWRMCIVDKQGYPGH